MGEASDRILEWTREMDSHSTAEWDRMPEIYLYMDQVITYMNGQLHLFERDENTALLTSSMINNYVKAGVLERPDKKKYGRDHLAMLTVICILKQVLSIPDIAKLLEDARGEREKRELYENFRSAQFSAVKEVCSRVAETVDRGDGELLRLATILSIEASARRTAAERIISELSLQKKAEQEKEKK